MPYFRFILTDIAVSAWRILKMKNGGAVLSDLVYDDCEMSH